MKTRLMKMMLVGLCLLAGFGHGRAQDAPWADWQLERDEYNSYATYSPDFADEEAPRVQTVLIKDSGESGDPYEDLQDALLMFWLEMNEIEAVDVSQPDRLVVWGDVDAEHGERRFAAVLGPSPDGPLVTAFVATEEDFEAMGGPAFIGGNPDAAQSLESALSSGAAALQPGAFGTGEASETSTDEAGTDETSADEASETSAEPADDAPAVAEPSDNADASSEDAAAAPIPVAVTREDGTAYLIGWEKDGQKGYTPWPGDPASPRVQYWTFEVGEVSTPEEAAESAIEAIGLSEAEYTAPRLIPSHVQIAGSEGYVVLGTGRAGGEPQSFALLIKREVEDGHFYTELLHAPPAIYESWGGIMAPLTTFGILLDDLRGALGPELQQQILKAPLDEQSEVFVQVTELNINYLMQEMMATWMMQQQSTLGTMQQMNANIATETSCILTPGCQVEYDSNGDAQMTQP